MGSWYTGGGGGQCSIDKKPKGCRLTTHKIHYSQWKMEYDLSPYLQTWLHDGTFPEKLIWKRTVRNVVSTVQTQLRTDRTITDQTLRQFWHIFDQSTPCSIWKSPKNCWDISVTKFVCKIYALSDTYQEHQLCPLCDFAVTNLFQHASCSCPCTFDMREEWWLDIANFVPSLAAYRKMNCF